MHPFIWRSTVKALLKTSQFPSAESDNQGKEGEGETDGVVHRFTTIRLRRVNSLRRLEGSRVAFNICDNKYRLIVKINYPYRVVYIRFVGTHAEYDQVDAETICRTSSRSKPTPITTRR